MADRRAALALLPLLAACGQQGGAGEGDAMEAGEPISCAISPASSMSMSCRVERAIEDGALFLTIHHENGGFRRLRVMEDGSGVTAADGADDARITVFDGEIEVELGGDHYLLPATITATDAVQ
ncbi:hypothetical protein [Alteraurantiacibacter aquimixticola]|uniref:Uncharacterized protein n=1 Tax=Alteraurantiacibacter aquimixticola TaxID=2489173 RepID=A0A4T3EYY5_9SPHN|nr:hypothetical protein [Alteraurantiacibacter aquimixticola]TIX49952.1 hypothetical protein E5222_06495 [Alteraurantiacibacter aquimixticola]